MTEYIWQHRLVFATQLTNDIDSWFWLPPIEIIANRNSSNFYVDIAKKENGTWGGAVQDTNLTWTGETIFEKEFKTAEDACEEIIRYCLKKKCQMI